MGSNKSRILIIVAALVSLLVLYFALFYNPGKHYDWHQDYKLDKERPYGTWLVSELLKEYEPQRTFKQLNKPLDHSLINAKTPGNYIFIGQEIYLDQSYTNSLLDFVEKGNNAFVFTAAPPRLLQAAINKAYENEVMPDSVFEMKTEPTEKEEISETEDFDSEEFYAVKDFSFEYKNYSFDTIFNEIYTPELMPENPYRFIYQYHFKLFNYNWGYIKDDELDDVSSEIIGGFYGVNSEGDTLRGNNFFAIDYGKGKFYFHTQPILFTNIIMLDTNSFDYTNSVFGFLNEGPVYWDEFNWQFNRPTAKTRVYNPFDFSSGESPLKFILNNPPLKWGWYPLLLFVFLFMIFEGKRRQAAIPVLADTANTTLGHIETLAKLYFKKNDHFAIAQKMMENFYGFCVMICGLTRLKRSKN